VLSELPLPVTGAPFVRSYFSYRYNWLISGAETNAGVTPWLPHVSTNGAVAGGVVANPMKQIPMASETMLFIDYPQLVCFQTDDKGGTDRGMDSASEKSFGVQTVAATGERHQLFRQIAPVHGLIKASSRALSAFLTDGTPSLQGSINVCYCDGSVRTVDISQGLYGPNPVNGNPGNKADPSGKLLLNDSTAGGAIRSGGYAPVPGTRIDPTLAP